MEIKITKETKDSLLLLQFNEGLKDENEAIQYLLNPNELFYRKSEHIKMLEVIKKEYDFRSLTDTVHYVLTGFNIWNKRKRNKYKVSTLKSLQPEN